VEGFFHKGLKGRKSAVHDRWNMPGLCYLALNLTDIVLSLGDNKEQPQHDKK
jgi:hypothetical protein